MVKIKSEDLKIMIPVVAVFVIMLAVTIIYPKYEDIWNLLFWIGILYMSIKTLSDSNAKNKSLKEDLLETNNIKTDKQDNNIEENNKDISN